MLVCPQCQFENPDSNNFCQKCGTSLTQKTCPECGSSVPFDAKQCPSCSTTTATVWQAIVCGQTAAKTDDVPTWGYLDAKQRYQLLEPWPPQNGSQQDMAVKVLDCQPFQMSILETLFYQVYSDTESDTKANAAATETATEINADAASEVWVEESQPATSAVTTTPTNLEDIAAMAIPAIAEPYLALQAEFYHTLPGVHDAWQQDQQSVLLLEDRSHLPLLADLWCESQVSPLQILYWLREISEIWDVLAAWHCCQSLLELSNLRVDEDQVFCLQRLYGDLDGTSPTLQDLGKFWQELFDQSQRTQVASLALLLRDLQEASIQTTNQLRVRLQAIAQELQSAFTAPMMNPELSAPDFMDDASPENPADSVSPHTLAADPDGTSESSHNSPLKQLSTLADLEDSSADDAPTVVLPMQLVSLEDAGRTDIGRQREHNEDYFGIHTKLNKIESPQGCTVQAKGLYILCDGMGGHAGGEVASALAANTLRDYFQTLWLEPQSSEAEAERREQSLPTEAEIREAVRLANLALYDINQQNARSGSGRMGTTLVLVLIQGTNAVVAHVGDSRIYRLSRRQGLEQVTVDHEVGQREIQRGVEPDIAYARPDAYQLTQALGPRDENFINPDVQFLDLTEDTLLLLCSDGLSDHDLIETHWRSHLEPLLSSQANLERGVTQLIDLANQYNGHDNITAIAIRVRVRPNLAQLRQSAG
ncbi:MAG: serine/threonine phosphatase [Trichocoleus desertorum ATA4-8-CV12]|jgi:protein phosphatase|nr:serine/threonine phosphatase [Trichocoleus desertorum ATA4-8-CV12]